LSFSLLTNTVLVKMAMSEEEVQQQLHNMVNFIHKEAQEKAQEIRIKAEEEYNIEKTTIVQEQKKKINAEFEEKMKKVETSRKM
jgi:V-type H+-transporting ATPase subunit E